MAVTPVGPSRLRFPLVGAAMVMLLGGVYTGLVRIGWNLPSQLAGLHGPLMVCGFLGTLITVERAVALGKVWFWLAPGFCLAGTALVIAPLPPAVGIGLITLASLLLAILFVRLLVQHRAFYLWIMAAGAAAWLLGNLLWLGGWPIYSIAWWWATFLLLTILGERIELSRFMAPNPFSPMLCMLVLCVMAMGLVIQPLAPAMGVAVTGLSFVLLAGWLVTFDIARRTVKQKGLPRFVAVCLLSGYGWLALGGVLAIVAAVVMPAMRYGGARWLDAALTNGGAYDAVLHALFLGFVFGMIFGHAPIIFPAVLRVRLEWSPRLYSHWAVLQATLVVRMVADLFDMADVRRWSGLFNAVALGLFVINTLLSVRLRGVSPPSGGGTSRR